MLLLADIRNWIRNIEQHASDNVNKILIGNKADMDESKRVCSVLYCLFPCYAAILFEIVHFNVKFNGACISSGMELDVLK